MIAIGLNGSLSMVTDWESNFSVMDLVFSILMGSDEVDKI